MNSSETGNSGLEERMENWLKSLTEYQDREQEIPRELQARVLHELRDCFLENMENRNKGELAGEALERFLENCRRCLGMISDEMMVMDESLPQKKRLPYEVWAAFCGLKYEGRAVPEWRPWVTLELMEAEQGVWRADCSVDEWVARRMKFSTVLNGQELPLQRISCYCGTRFFGKEVAPRYLFRAEIPARELRRENILQFTAGDGASEGVLPVMTARYQSRLTRMLRNSYWCFGDYMVTLGQSSGAGKEEADRVLIQKAGRGRRVRRELALLKEMALAPYGSKKLALVRSLYWVTRPAYRRKRIWITFDKLYKGGDCGEYLYKYLWKQSRESGKAKPGGGKGQNDWVGKELKGSDGKEPGDCGGKGPGGFSGKSRPVEELKRITPVYVIRENSADWKRLRQEGYKPAAYRSLGQRLAYLNASVVFGTHSSVHSFCGFNNWEVLFVQDRLRAVNTCVQHGLSVQDLRFDSNRLVNNNKRYYCASRYEVENLSRPDYGYGPDVLRLTGIPRYDGLTDRRRKQILIAPTWRAYIAMPSVMGETRPYYPGFKDTEYYRIFQELLENPTLCRTAARTGYRILYLLHPVISAQKKDFRAGEGVEILSAAEINYEQVLTESGLMVTDYSGVQFDFAYMRKPVVYFHPAELPPHYVEGGFDYDSQGFGEICRETEELVRILCAYMEKDCELKPFYRERQDDFFAFEDRESCGRICEDALALGG